MERITEFNGWEVGTGKGVSRVLNMNASDARDEKAPFSTVVENLTNGQVYTIRIATAGEYTRRLWKCLASIEAQDGGFHFFYFPAVFDGALYDGRGSVVSSCINHAPAGVF